MEHTELTHAFQGLKVALVHEWLVALGGSEQFLRMVHDMFPQAPIYTLVYDKERAPAWTRSCDIRTTYLQKVPGAIRHHKKFLSLMPGAWESLDLTEYDLVISSCSSCCKGVLTRSDAVHVCYCHSPIRYVWDLYQEYLRDASPITRAAMKTIIPRIRQWDFVAAQRVDHFISNSDYVAGRIRKFYRRDAHTVYSAVPKKPAELREPQGYYLVVSRFVSYKRVDLAIQACNLLGRKLLIAGSGGEEQDALRQIAGPSVEFLGFVSDEQLAEVYAGADALLFPGVEDFGLTPPEAMAYGVPVLAYGKGGVLETVEEGKTGHFFHEQSAESLARCIEEFEQNGVELSRKEISERTLARFNLDAFRRDLLGEVARCCTQAGLISFDQT